MSKSSFEHEGEEKLGYRQPPVATRFRAGRSGNPRGRPKKERALGAMVARAFAEQCVVVENKVSTRMTKLEATLKQFANKAAKGDYQAAKFLLALHPGAKGGDAPPPDAETLSEADDLVIKDLVRRLSEPSE